MPVLHGEIQRARLTAESTKTRSMTREAPDGWQLWIMEDGAWVYIGKFTRRRDLAPMIEHYFPQPD